MGLTVTGDSKAALLFAVFKKAQKDGVDVVSATAIRQ